MICKAMKLQNLTWEFFKKYFYLFIWLHGSWLKHMGIFNLCCDMWNLQLRHTGFLVEHENSQLQHVGSSSLTRDQIQAPSTGSTESQSVDHQEFPQLGIKLNQDEVSRLDPNNSKSSNQGAETKSVKAMSRYRMYASNRTHRTVLPRPECWHYISDTAKCTISLRAGIQKHMQPTSKAIFGDKCNESYYFLYEDRSSTIHPRLEVCELSSSS